MGEKRSHVRYLVNADVTLKTEEGASYNFKRSVTNLSFLGAGVFSKETIVTGNDIVQFELLSEVSSAPLIGRGKIKYIEKQENRGATPVYKIGLEFVDIDKTALLYFMKRLQDLRTAKMKKIQRARKAAGSESLGAY